MDQFRLEIETEVVERIRERGLEIFGELLNRLRNELVARHHRRHFTSTNLRKEGPKYQKIGKNKAFQKIYNKKKCGKQ